MLFRSFPDVPADTCGAPAWRWAATLWPDALEPSGWARLLWTPGERGWRIPETLSVGDVVEFGVAWNVPWGSGVDSSRWFGWVTHCTERALVLDGPYHDAREAHAAARPTIDEIRLLQLAGPRIGAELFAEWDRAAGEA